METCCCIHLAARWNSSKIKQHYLIWFLHLFVIRYAFKQQQFVKLLWVFYSGFWICKFRVSKGMFNSGSDLWQLPCSVCSCFWYLLIKKCNWLIFLHKNMLQPSYWRAGKTDKIESSETSLTGTRIWTLGRYKELKLVQIIWRLLIPPWLSDYPICSNNCCPALY